MLNGGRKKNAPLNSIVDWLIYVQICSENNVFHCAESFELIVQ